MTTKFCDFCGDEIPTGRGTTVQIGDAALRFDIDQFCRDKLQEVVKGTGWKGAKDAAAKVQS